MLVLRDVTSNLRTCDGEESTSFGMFYSRLFRKLAPELSEADFDACSMYLGKHVPVVRLCQAPVVYEDKLMVHLNQEHGKPKEGVCQVAFCMKVWLAVEQAIL